MENPTFELYIVSNTVAHEFSHAEAKHKQKNCETEYVIGITKLAIFFDDISVIVSANKRLRNFFHGFF